MNQQESRRPRSWRPRRNRLASGVEETRTAERLNMMRYRNSTANNFPTEVYSRVAASLIVGKTEIAREGSRQRKNGSPLGHIAKTHKPQPADSCARPCGIVSSGRCRIDQESAMSRLSPMRVNLPVDCWKWNGGGLQTAPPDSKYRHGTLCFEGARQSSDKVLTIPCWSGGLQFQIHTPDLEC
jgi:hypothetical protein